MTAATAGRSTPELDGHVDSYPVKGSTKIIQGTIACIDANGYLVPGSTATTLKVVGCAQQTIDNTGGADGAVRCDVKRGIFGYANSASTDAITQADVKNDCYIVDNQTVAKTDGSSTRSKGGKIVKVDGGVVYVAQSPLI